MKEAATIGLDTGGSQSSLSQSDQAPGVFFVTPLLLFEIVAAGIAGLARP